MTDVARLSPRQKPKSLLEVHQDADALIQALNEYAASQQNPVSQDMTSDFEHSSSSRTFLCSSPLKSTSPDPPEPSSQDQSQDTNPVASTSANPDPKLREILSTKRSGIPRRRKPVIVSEQPSVATLLELGVKVRDFGYESTLPPVPTVYLQPRQIQPSVPKDVNDPNDPHYILEEERKKKVYTIESTRKIQRTPTEPVLESDLLPPRRTLPKIRRTDALLDIGSQFDSEPQSQPLPSYPALPYDITNTSQAASQPIPGLTMDSQQTEPWVDTPIVTPNGSLQWPEEPTSSTSPSTATQPKVVDLSASPPNPSMASEMSSTAGSDSQVPPEPETMSYAQMGFAPPDSQAPISEGSAVESSMPIPSSLDRKEPNTSAVPRPSSPKRDMTPTNAIGRVEPTPPRVDNTPLIPTSPIAPSPTRVSPRASSPLSPVSSDGVRSPSLPIAGPSKLPKAAPASPSDSTSPRYHLRIRTKRRAESPPPFSPTRNGSTRAKRARAVSNPTAPVARSPQTISVNSVHLQNKAVPGVVSTGRTVKRRRERDDDNEALTSEIVEVYLRAEETICTEGSVVDPGAGPSESTGLATAASSTQEQLENDDDSLAALNPRNSIFTIGSIATTLPRYSLVEFTNLDSGVAQVDQWNPESRRTYVLGTTSQSDESSPIPRDEPSDPLGYTADAQPSTPPVQKVPGPSQLGRSSSAQQIGFGKPSAREPWATLNLISQPPLPGTRKRTPRFIGGDPTRGSVDLRLDAPMNVHSIKLAIRGKAHFAENPTRIATGHIFLYRSYTIYRKQTSRDPGENGRCEVSKNRVFDGNLHGSYSFPFSIAFPTTVEWRYHTQEKSLRNAQAKPVFTCTTSPSFREQSTTSAIIYEIEFEVKHGALKSRSKTVAEILYTPKKVSPPASVKRQIAYREGALLPGPSADTDGWQALPALITRGQFRFRPVEATCIVRLMG
ncbi:hypothetical protein NP233_g6286 [Leucocoprinus birnbaumii]|uniref:Uncharacterized protein n=1 Tax=Leucocoprinus birnbaumii TaxID=56174 RepID=A0AAD5VUS9_9AGAR|nr:hypothetical protein NP233_g6286 [Leucocoprinus birnbaumii]